MSGDAASEATLKRLVEMQKEAQKKIEDELKGLRTDARSDAKEARKEKPTNNITSGIASFAKDISSWISPLKIAGFGLGVLATVTGAAVGAVQEMTKTITIMYSSGARFQGEMFNLAAQAGLAGMSIEDFGAMIAKSQGAIARFGGGSLSDGARKMGQFAQTLAFGDAKLAGLGLGIKEISELLVDYSDNQRTLNDNNITALDTGETQEMADARVLRGTQNYIQGLDSLARATGKTRDEMNNLVKDLSKDVDLRANLSRLGLSNEQRDDIVRVGTMLTTLGGPSMMTGLNSMMQFGTMTGDTASAMAIIGGDFADTFYDVTAKLRSGQITGDEALQKLQKSWADNAESMSDALGNIPEQSRTQAMKEMVAGAFMAKRQQEAREGELKEYIKQQRARGEAIKTDAELTKEFDEQRSKEAADMVKMNTMMTKIRNVIPAMLARIFANDTFQRFFNWMIDKLTTLTDSLLTVIDHSTGIWDMVKNVATNIWTNGIKPIFADMGRWLYDDVLAPIGKFIKDWWNTDFKEMMADVFYALGFKGTANSLRGQVARYRMGDNAPESAIQTAAHLVDVQSKMSDLERKLQHINETELRDGKLGEADQKLKKQWTDELDALSRESSTLKSDLDVYGHNQERLQQFDSKMNASDAVRRFLNSENNQPVLGPANLTPIETNHPRLEMPPTQFAPIPDQFQQPTPQETQQGPGPIPYQPGQPTTKDLHDKLSEIYDVLSGTRRDAKLAHA